jgi:hypothetical protein
MCFTDFNLQIPGHAILRAVLPMAIGLALVPRKNGGTVMGVAALGGELPGLGACTSLALLGPMLDLALRSSAAGPISLRKRSSRRSRLNIRVA